MGSMKPQIFDPSWYARVMKSTSAVVLACGPTGSGVKLWSRRRLLGHRDDEVLADNAMAALDILVPKMGQGDNPTEKATEAKEVAVRKRLAEIRKFAASAPVIMNWTTRDLGVDPTNFDPENLGLPGALIDGVDVILYVMRDGRITDDITKCFVLKTVAS